MLIDECLPLALRHDLVAYDVATVAFMGWRGLADNMLLDRADGRFDIVLTADKGIGGQQRLSGRSFGVVVVSTERLGPLRAAAASILEAIDTSGPGSLTTVEISRDR